MHKFRLRRNIAKVLICSFLFAGQKNTTEKQAMAIYFKNSKLREYINKQVIKIMNLIDEDKKCT